MTSAATLTDHRKIKDWAKERGARPAIVKDTEDGGVLRFDFGDKDESLEPISWDEFFRIFDSRNLALLEQDETESGHMSRFFKFVERNGGSQSGSA